MRRPQFSLKTLLWLVGAAIVVGAAIYVAFNPITPKMTMTRIK